MNARELYQAGKLDEAVRTLSTELRDNPADAQRRTFLFELLCFAGDYERAEKQLEVLGQGSEKPQLGVMLYRAALQAEKTRQELFGKKEYPRASQGDDQSSTPSGTLNGSSFESFSDADPRIGARLEIFAAGSYLWLPFEQIASIEMQPPKRLRDLLWIPAVVRTRSGSKDLDFGEVLLPVLSPLSWKQADDALRLGRVTDWKNDESGVLVPVGQKMFVVDGEDFPFLEMRQLEFSEVKRSLNRYASA